MCGIVGKLSWNQQAVDADAMASMIDMVRHRGPDSVGIYTNNGIGLAHARLSVIDLESGRQPMKTADGRFVITFNGEIYNYVELRETLMARGCQFRTRSDTEVVLHAFREYGARCVEYFNGQWALAIWDDVERRLFLSRDRFGIRPLFYTRAEWGFLFASEIKSLFAHQGVAREIDPRGLCQLLTYWAPLAPVTLFRGIEEFPPGHNLFVDANRRIRPSRYWSLDYEPETACQSSEEWGEELRELLADATRLRLRADVPVGAYLSGGLDSTVTASLTRRFCGDRLRTFSVTFDDEEYDESEHQRTAAACLGGGHRALQCTYHHIARVFPQVVWHAEKPVFRTAAAPLKLLAEMVHAAGLRVVLTGEGADEMLGGYDIFKEAKVRRFCATQCDSKLRARLFSELYPYLPNVQAQPPAFRQAFFRTSAEDLKNPLVSHLPRWRMSEQTKRFLTADYAWDGQANGQYEAVMNRLPADFGRWPPFCQAQYLETAILMPGYILSTQGDRMAMAHGVEGRFPFLDHRVAQLAARLPPRLKMKGIEEKYLLKKAFRDVVPREIARRKKQPYRAPDAASFFTRDWKSTREDYVSELLSPERLQEGGVFQPPVVAKLLRKIDNGNATSTRDNMAFVTILSTQILIDQFINRFPRRQTSAEEVLDVVPT